MWKADITVEFADGSTGAAVQDSAYKLYAMQYATNLVRAMVIDGREGRGPEVVSHRINLTQEV